MKVKILVALLLISLPLLALQDWQTYTNTTHLYDLIEYNNQFYVSTWGGVLKYSHNYQLSDQELNTINGLSSNDVRSMAVTAQSNNLLLATSDAEIDRMLGDDFILKISQEIGLPAKSVNMVLTNADYIFVATSQGVTIFQENSEFPIPITKFQYNMENGLSANDITSIALNQDYLFCGSEAGLDYIELDLLQAGDWTNLHSDNSPLPSSMITSLSASDAKLAVATKAGLAVVELDDDSWQVYTEAEHGIPHASIYPVEIDSMGDIWFGWGEWVEADLAVVDSSNIFVSRLDPAGNFSHFSAADLGLLSTRLKNIRQLDDKIYFLTWGEGFVFYEMGNRNWSEQFVTNSISSNFVRTMQLDHNQKLWVANGRVGNESSPRFTRGLSAFDGSTWQNFTKYNSDLVTDNIFDLAVDNNNRIWMSSWGSGLSYFEPSNQTFSNINLQNYPELQYENSDGSLAGPSRTVTCVETLQQGEIAFSTYPHYLAILDETELLHQFTLYQPADNLEFSDFLEIKQFGDLYFVGTRYNGLRIWQGEGYPADTGAGWQAPAPSQMRASEINDIVHRKDNLGYDEYWIASSQGLFCYKEKPRFSFDNQQYPAGYYWYRYGQEAKKKQIYVESSWQDQETPEFWYVVGQPYLYGGAITVPSALFIDPFGRVWIGTADSGFTIYDVANDDFQHFNSENSALVNDLITDFAYDPFTGKLYIGTANGLSSTKIGISAEYNMQTKLNEVRVYPNPFYPAEDSVVRIENVASLTMPSGEASCKIFDISGDLILELEKNEYEQFSWDGNNAAGKQCSSGVYFYLISASEGQTARGKIVLVR